MSKIYEGWNSYPSGHKNGDLIRFFFTLLWYTAKGPLFLVRGDLE